MMFSVMKNEKHPIGCVIDCSALSADDLNYEIIAYANSFGFDGDITETDPQILSEIADEAVEFLNCLEELPPYCYYQVEDNSLFLLPDLDTAKEDLEILGGFVSNEKIEYPLKTEKGEYVGHWLHINDHGNATLYKRVYGKDLVIWEVV